ncbi:MAG: PH domain-containing protein [Longispora sp.]|nr:PH domain-containing protein [Longispora sp. (in: high G+C Gram-positive bacteria)]
MIKSGELETVSARPRRATIVCWIAAVALVTVFTLVAVGLRGQREGVAVFGVGDQIAMIILGLLGGAAILWFTRPSVEADRSGIRVRNLMGSYDLPWGVVQGIRFDRGDSWAILELADDEVLAVLALQSADKERTVQAVRGLRDLHSAALVG